LTHLVRDTIWGSLSRAPKPLLELWRSLKGEADPNDRRVRRGKFEGVCLMPLATRGHRRTGTRERLLAVRSPGPNRLRLEAHAAATKVIFDADNRAIGVDFLRGANLYRAHAVSAASDGIPCRVRARREVILAGGSFNSPQLLMLSGIGPAEALRI